MTCKRNINLDKQDTPRQQIASCLQAALGDISNLIDRATDPSTPRLRRLEDFLERAMRILEGMPEGEWENG